MIPRLFEKDATSFTNYGICPLIDATDCKVTEERNGGFTLSLSYPSKGRWATELTVDRIILADPCDNASQAEPFRITKIEYDIAGNIEVEAVHISYQLTSMVVNKTSVNTRYPASFWSKMDTNLISTSNPFTFNTDMTDASQTVHTFAYDKPNPFRTLLGGMKGSMLDLYGGEFEWKRWQVNLWKARGADNGVKIAYTKNLTGLDYSVDISDVYTGVVAFWANQNDYVVSDLQTVAHTYSFSRDIIYDASSEFQTKPTVAQLNTLAANKAANAPTPIVSVNVKFIPLWQTDEYRKYYALEHVSLCDTVEVIYPPLNMDVRAKVVETVYDVLADRYDEITISTVKRDITDTIFTLMKEVGDV